MSVLKFKKKQRKHLKKKTNSGKNKKDAKQKRMFQHFKQQQKKMGEKVLFF
jgi:malate synthase